MPPQAPFEPELMDAIPDATVVVNRSGEIISPNRPAAALFDYPLEQLIGMTIEQLIPTDLRSGHKQTRRTSVTTPRDARWAAASN